MIRLMLALTLLSLTTEAVHSAEPDQSESPKSVAPLISVAQMTDDGMISMIVSRNVEQRRTIPGPVVDTNGKVIQEGPIEVRETVLVHRVQLLRFDAIEVCNVKGEKIADKDVVQLLRTKRPVLHSADGKKVDPQYLQVFKDDTLVLAWAVRLPMNLHFPLIDEPLKR